MNLQETLRDEAEGILAWIVEGAIQWFSERLQDPTRILRETTDYRDTSDELAGFVGQIVVADPDSSISGRELFEAFMDWCLEENIQAWSRRAFFASMKERFPDCRKHKRNDGVHFEGLRLEET